MKKATVILLLLIYGSAAMGTTIHLHYCMNEFVGWSLFHGRDEKCGRCGMMEKDKGDCCKDEHKHFKLKADHQKVNGSQLIAFISTPVLFIPLVDFDTVSYTVITKSYSSSHAPPDISRKRLHILYSVFLI